MRTSWNSGRAKRRPTALKRPASAGTSTVRSRAPRRARPRGPGRRRRRRSARSRAGRGPSRTRPTAARASSARSRSRGSRSPPRAASARAARRRGAPPARRARRRSRSARRRPCRPACSRARRSRRSPSARRRRGRSRPGPGSAPALRGPTWRPPAGSSQAIVPPPAPTSAMSIVGIRSSSPAPRISRLPADSEPPTSYSRPRETAPSSISDAFAVVPPMSKAIALSTPSRSRHPEGRDDAGGRARLEREAPAAPSRRPRSSRRPRTA